jgi:hypothetical protein
MATQIDGGVQLPGSAAQPDTSKLAANAIEAVVFREILKPLAESLGPVGETALDAVADSFFVRPKA